MDKKAKQPYRRLARTAVAGAIALAFTPAAMAVNINPKGTGQVLIFPYYTTRTLNDTTPQATVVSVVNTTEAAKAVSVKFYEGRNNRMVLGLNVFMAPFDTWTTLVVADGATGGARIALRDAGCTLPKLAAAPVFMSFTDAAYAGNASDGAGTGLDRTREGYVEVIEMSTYAAGSKTDAAVSRANGPPSCDITDAQAGAEAQPLAGGLMGSAEIIAPDRATSFVTEPAALDNFHVIGPHYVAAGSPPPDLTQASPPVSVVVGPNGNVYTSMWQPGTAHAVSAVLMTNGVLNQFATDASSRSATDWVATMPTKGFYTSAGSGDGKPPFQRNFSAGAGACDDVKISLYDREDAPRTLMAGPLCWAANVITANNANVLGSSNAVTLPISMRNGWQQITFPTGIEGANASVHRLVNTTTSITVLGGATSAGNTVTYVGLPVIGFAAIVRTGPSKVPAWLGGPAAGEVTAKPGGNTSHRYAPSINLP